MVLVVLSRVKEGGILHLVHKLDITSTSSSTSCDFLT